MSPISYSKDWLNWHDPFNGRVYLCFSIGLKYGHIYYYHIKLDADAQKLCTIVFQWYMGKYEHKRLPMGINIAWFLMFFKNSCLNLSKIWNTYRQPYNLDDLLMLTNSSFKDHLLKLETVLARFSANKLPV
jgi:hypothetical protein